MYIYISIASFSMSHNNDFFFYYLWKFWRSKISDARRMEHYWYIRYKRYSIEKREICSTHRNRGHNIKFSEISILKLSATFSVTDFTPLIIICCSFAVLNGMKFEGLSAYRPYWTACGHHFNHCVLIFITSIFLYFDKEWPSHRIHMNRDWTI